MLACANDLTISGPPCTCTFGRIPGTRKSARNADIPAVGAGPARPAGRYPRVSPRPPQGPQRPESTTGTGQRRRSWASERLSPVVIRRKLRPPAGPELFDPRPGIAELV